MSFARGEPEGRRRFSSLTFRVNAWYAGVLLVGLAALGALVLTIVRRGIDHEDLVLVAARLERHRLVLERGGLPELERAVAHAAELEGESGPVRVRDRAGKTLYQRGDIDHARTLISTTVSRDLEIEIASAEPPWVRLGPHLRTALVVLLAGFLLLGIGGGVYLTRKALRPVAALARTAREIIQSGDLSRRVNAAQGHDELSELARLVNRMLDRNQELVRGMREALDNVAHDLRTPLARLRGIAEVALGGADAATARDALADCIEESDRVIVMLRSLMDISEAEAGIMRLAAQPTDVTTLAQEVVELYGHVAEEAGVALSLETTDAVTASVDANRLRQALANLVDNAVKYTSAGGSVALSVVYLAGDVEIRVRDTGRGIPADALPRIWDRLYRVDPSRSEQGLGLGLSLVKAIAAAHGGRYRWTVRRGGARRFSWHYRSQATFPEPNSATPLAPERGPSPTVRGIPGRTKEELPQGGRGPVDSVVPVGTGDAKGGP